MESNGVHKASESVLATYELVEHILSYLDFRDLMRAQQVCTQWRNVAQRSQLLRYHLFLERFGHEKTSLNWKHDTSTSIIRRYPARKIYPNPVLRYSPRDGFTSFSCEIILRYQDVLRMLSWHAGLWEGMLMSIPPPRKVVLRVGGARWSGDFVTIVDDTGIRLGHLRSSMLKLLRVKDGPELKDDLMRIVEMLGLRVHIYES